MSRYPVTDYRKLRPGNLCSEQFRHLLYLLYWPIFGLLFAFVERVGVTDNYHIVFSPLDDLIPFNEFFLVPYLFWFVYLVGMIVYALLYETDTFVRMMRYIILTYSAAMLVYLIYPTAQELRPAAFARDNLFTRFLTHFYAFDTNTNVCPSIHVIGSLAVLSAAWNSRRFRTPGWRAAFALAAVLISISTVFLKQHSILDVIAALPVCLVAWIIVYRRRSPRFSEKTAESADLPQSGAREPVLASSAGASEHRHP